MQKFAVPLSFLALTLPAAAAAAAQVTYPQRLGEHEFMVDEAKLIQQADADEIKKIGEELLANKSIPIAIVTIKSLAVHGAGSWRIESYARSLFTHWGLGRNDWNYGMMLLVSVSDRKARIEVGASWGHVKDPAAQNLMNSEIVPRFKRGEFSAGLLEGARGLKSIASDLVVPQTGGAPPSHPVTMPPTTAPRTTTPAPNIDYSRPHRTTGFSDSHWSIAGIIMVILIVVIGFMILSAIIRAIFGGGSASWGPGGYYGGGYGGGGGGGFGSSFGGSFLGTMLGNWLFGGYGYHRSWWDDGPPTSGGGGSWFSGGGSDYGGDSGGSSSSWGGGGDSGGGGGFSDGGGASGSW